MAERAVVAPHLDDAVLSAWHQIEQAGSQTLTLFAGIPNDPSPSWWDKATGQANAQTTMHLRRAENAAALAVTSTVVTNLHFLDRPYVQGARDIQAMADAVELNVLRHAQLIVAAGIGTLLRRHPDHITTRMTGLALRQRGRAVSFYADIPYTLPIHRFAEWPRRLPVEKLKRLFNADISVEIVELNKAQQTRKQAAVKAFATQFRLVNMLALGALQKPAAYRWEALIHCT